MIKQEQFAREKAAFAYSTALESGDFETVTAVLTQAEQDPILEQMLLELNEAQQEEMEANMVLKNDEMVEDSNGRDTQNSSPPPPPPPVNGNVTFGQRPE